MKIKFCIILILFVGVFTSCTEDFSPKAKAYPRIEWPEQKTLVDFKTNYCPFSFKIPSYTQINQDSLFFEKKPEHPCWVDVRYPMFNSTIHFSYKEIKKENDLQKLLNDTHKLTYKHTSKAEHIDEYIIETVNNVNGVIYDVGGNAASNFQFYVTDESDHFLRGALYFRNSPNVDSVGPILEYIKNDMLVMLESLEWENVD